MHQCDMSGSGVQCCTICAWCITMVYLIGPDGLVNRRFANFHEIHLIKSYEQLYEPRTLFPRTPGRSMMWYLNCATLYTILYACIYVYTLRGCQEILINLNEPHHAKTDCRIFVLVTPIDSVHTPACIILSLCLEIEISNKACISLWDVCAWQSSNKSQSLYCPPHGDSCTDLHIHNPIEMGHEC